MPAVHTLQGTKPHDTTSSFCVVSRGSLARPCYVLIEMEFGSDFRLSTFDFRLSTFDFRLFSQRASGVLFSRRRPAAAAPSVFGCGVWKRVAAAAAAATFLWCGPKDFSRK